MGGIMFSILIAGFGGGVVRGVVGIIKHQLRFKDAPFRLWYFLGTALFSGVVGVLTAIVVKETNIPVLGSMVTPGIAFVVGYAGGDFIENIYKIILGKSVL